MKKKGYLLLIIVALLVILFSIYIISVFQKRTSISEEDVNHMVLSQYQGEVTNITEITLNGEDLYKVEFQNNTGEYLLNLKKNTGEIFSLEAITTQETDINALSKQEAKQLVEEEVDGVVSDVQEEVQFYSITIINQEKEEIYLVDKYSGEVQLEDSDTAENPEQNAYLTEEEAIQLALEEIPGIITDIELEDDDNELIYDIEMESSDGREVSLYLNAYTGNILSINWEED